MISVYFTTFWHPLDIATLLSPHVAKLDMYSLLLVETTNDMPFSLPETKYDKPF